MARKAKRQGDQPPCWKVRIMMGGPAGVSMVHVLSSTEPELEERGELLGVVYTPLEGTPDGDTVGIIPWDEVIGASWRRAA